MDPDAWRMIASAGIALAGACVIAFVSGLIYWLIREYRRNRIVVPDGSLAAAQQDYDHMIVAAQPVLSLRLRDAMHKPMDKLSSAELEGCLDDADSYVEDCVTVGADLDPVHMQNIVDFRRKARAELLRRNGPGV